MRPVTSCPDLDLLQRLLAGEVPDDQVDSLAEHIDRCAACAEAIKALPGVETLLAGVESTFVDTLPPELRRVMDRLRRAPVESDETCGLETSVASLPDILAPPQASEEMGRLGNYRVLSVLGQGGMGAVFLAHDPQLDRQVALKVMLPRSAAHAGTRERFLREARLAARIEHDHIVPIYHVGEHQGLPYLVMPVLKGCSLAVLLKERGRLPICQVLRLGRQIALGLAAAHGQGLIHRDIKPANIWIEPGEGGRVKILDFGLARLEQDDTQLTQAGSVLNRSTQKGK